VQARWDLNNKFLIFVCGLIWGSHQRILDKKTPLGESGKTPKGIRGKEWGGLCLFLFENSLFW
jgi:hypothetical protein